MTALEDVVPLAVPLGEPGNDVAIARAAVGLPTRPPGTRNRWRLISINGGDALLAVPPGVVVDDPAALARGEPVAVRVEPAVAMGDLGPLGGDGEP